MLLWSSGSLAWAASPLEWAKTVKLSGYNNACCMLCPITLFNERQCALNHLRLSACPSSSVTDPKARRFHCIIKWQWRQLWPTLGAPLPLEMCSVQTRTHLKEYALLSQSILRLKSTIFALNFTLSFGSCMLLCTQPCKLELEPVDSGSPAGAIAIQMPHWATVGQHHLLVWRMAFDLLFKWQLRKVLWL